MYYRGARAAIVVYDVTDVVREGVVGKFAMVQVTVGWCPKFCTHVVVPRLLVLYD